MSYRLGFDVGGTFTDVLLVDERAGSTWRRQIWRAPTAVTAQGKHQPLQWNSGSVHRYTEFDVKPCSITSPSAFIYPPRCVYITPLGKPVVPLV